MKIVNMKKGNWGKVVAFFDLITEDGFTIKGFKLVDNGNAKFAGFPSQKGNDGEYYPTVFAEKDIKEKVGKLAVAVFQNEESTKEFNKMFNEDQSTEEMF